jgi:chaperonin cofactor prefoldin
MFRRWVFEAVGGFDTSLRAAEDYEMYLRVARRFPVCNHEEVVAEYRHHGAGMTRNLPRMLSHSVGVLRSQRGHVKGRKDYETARKDGLRWERGRYGDPLVEEVRAQLKEGKWGRALRGVLVLVRYYPQGFTLLFMERRRLARRLEASKRKLETRERYLEDLEDTRKESESALAREREEVQRLSKRIGRLEQRIQDLNRQAQSGLRPRIRRLSKKIVGRF